MTFPSPAQRTDWMQTNNEAAHALDTRYGTGHRPTYAAVGAGWVADCACPNPRCERGCDNRRYTTWDEAFARAATNLTDATTKENRR